MPQPQFDEERAINLLEAFSATSGIGATLFCPNDERNVEVRYAQSACRALCPHCQPIEKGEYWPEECKMVHRLASVFADNYGSSYIYMCPEDHLFFVSPIVSDSRLVGAATMGPVHITSTAEVEAERAEAGESASIAPAAEDVYAEKTLPAPYFATEDSGIPLRTGEYLQRLALVMSSALFSVSAVSDNYRRMVTENKVDEPNSASAPLLGTKSLHAKDYPVAFETDLQVAIREANAASARHALNELLGYLLSSSLVDTRYLFRERIDELAAVVAHAALRAGVTAEVMFPSIERCRKDLNFISSEDQMCSRLHHFVEQTIGLVQNLYDVDFDDFKYRALSFIHSNYRHHISLDEAADALGFSTSHFSRSFKEHMGCTFVTYLNEVRIQAAKSELIATDTSIADIAEAVGFENTSYFIRVFKREVGMTPGAYRSHRGQLNSSYVGDLELHRLNPEAVE